MNDTRPDSSRPRRNLVLTGLTLAIALIAVGVAVARPAAPGSPLRAGLFPPGQIVDVVAERLELDDGQRLAIRQIFVDHSQELETSLVELREARATLFDAIHTHPPRDEEIRAAAAAAAEADVELALLRAEIADEIHSVLDPVQRERAAQLVEDARAVIDHVAAFVGTAIRLRLAA